MKRPGLGFLGKLKRVRRRVGPLPTIALLFVVSAGLRLWDGTGEAIAREFVGLDGASVPALSEAMCEPDPGLEAALEAIQKREDRVAERERALADRIRALEVAEATVDRKLAELEAAEESILGTMARAQSASEEDLTRLTSVYENMKPKDAAKLFATMDPEFAAGFLGRMRADAAAEVLAGLDPDTAYSISVLLAGRNAKAPKE